MKVHIILVERCGRDSRWSNTNVFKAFAEKEDADHLLAALKENESIHGRYSDVSNHYYMEEVEVEE